MKVWKLAVLSVIMVSCSAQADVERDVRVEKIWKLEDLEKKIVLAVRERSFELLDVCYSKQDVHSIHRDLDSFYWKGVFSRHQAEGVKFKSIKWFEPNDIDNVNTKNSITKKHVMRGREYKWNLEVLGAFKVEYKDDSGSNTNWLLAGKDSKGNWKLVTTKVVQLEKVK